MLVSTALHRGALPVLILLGGLTHQCLAFTCNPTLAVRPGPSAKSVTPFVNPSHTKRSVAWTGVMEDRPPQLSDRLSEYVAAEPAEAWVDYAKLSSEGEGWLAEVIGIIKATDPTTLSTGDRHAFLINAYNLWTIHWVLSERKNRRWKGHLGTLDKARFFYLHKVSTGAGKYNLYNFENKVIRPEVRDARVHFALNCASVSCPPLRRSLYTGANLDSELDEVTSAAVNGGAMVQPGTDDVIRVNPIFKWYKEDFDKEGGVVAFLSKHWKGATPLPDNAKLEFFEYDWRQNSIDAPWTDRQLAGPAP
ncbi:unnamed protein product [Discosporangium mesarthrocarpum]